MAWRRLVPILRSSWYWTWRQSYSAIASRPYPRHWERSLQYGYQAGRTYNRSCCGRCNHFLRFVVLRRRLSQEADPITSQAVSGHAQVDAPSSPASQGPARGLDSNASGQAVRRWSKNGPGENASIAVAYLSGRRSRQRRPVSRRTVASPKRVPEASSTVDAHGIDSIEAKSAEAALEAGSMLSSAKARSSARSISRANMCAVSPVRVTPSRLR